MSTRLALAFAALFCAAAAATAGEVAPALREAAERSEVVDALIVLKRVELATTSPVRALDRSARVAAVYDAARRANTTAQTGVAALLARRGVEFRAFTNVPVIRARLPVTLIDLVAARADVAQVLANPAIDMQLSAPSGMSTPSAKLASAKALGTIESTGAATLWAQGFRGAGVVVAGADTGYRAQHPALRPSFRGTGTVTIDPTYQWHDAIHEPAVPGDNPCGYDARSPCDDNGHGTHTMGTIVGRDGAYEIGMAPEAKWIGCRNMDRGVGTPASYIECLEWFLAPTDLDGNNPRPDLAPHVINNSWLCAPSEGCDAAHTALLQQAVDALHAAGILFVVAAGNAGRGGANDCGTISMAPATFAVSLTVGAASTDGAPAAFSSRGPVYSAGGRLKPELVAPGTNITSAKLPTGYTVSDGTSMAAPHVAGAAALLMSAFPELRGDNDLVREALIGGAVPRPVAQDCLPFAGSAVPNAVTGHGRLDVVAAKAYVEAQHIFRNGFE